MHFHRPHSVTVPVRAAAWCSTTRTACYGSSPSTKRSATTMPARTASAPTCATRKTLHPPMCLSSATACLTGKATCGSVRRMASCGFTSMGTNDRSMSHRKASSPHSLLPSPEEHTLCFRHATATSGWERRKQGFTDCDLQEPGISPSVTTLQSQAIPTA